MSKPFSLFLILLLLTLLVSPLLSLKVVEAQTENAYDLISVVNGLRSSKGLEAYQIDSYLMSYAQQHADYMASIQNSTHTHSDGSVAWESGIQENVAEGTEGIITPVHLACLISH